MTTHELIFAAALSEADRQVLRLCAASVAWDAELAAIAITPHNEPWGRLIQHHLSHCTRALPYRWVILQPV